jgi:two-component system cell cycle sensor histidine kinase/response regulator CckA
VTERRPTDDQLRLSEGRLRAVLDAALDAVVAMDAGDAITYWNPRAEAIFGWTREEALGRILSELIIPERYRDAHRRGLARFLATGVGPVLDRRIELQGLRRDGTEFPVELSITAVKEGGGYTFSAFVADITERKRAETELRRYADVFRNMQVGLNVWCLQDRDDLRSFKLISTNPAAAHSLGVRTEDVLGKRMDEAFPHMLDTDLPRIYREVVLSGEGRDLGEVHALYGEMTTDGVFAAKVFPLPGDCVGVAFENITEHRRLEDQLRQSQRLEAVGSLAGGIAHDFNNLLTVILGQSELLLGRLGAGDPSLKRVEEIRKAGERAASLTRQLLAFSRKQVLIPEVLDLGAVVADLASMLRRLIGEDIVLTTVARAGAGAVKADRGQVEQVIVNLVVNARDAMPEGGTISVEVADVDVDAAHAAGHPPTESGRFVMLAVRDTGVGMDAAVRAHIFEPFFTTKEKGKGTGLGLATVYGIVKQSGGYVSLDTEPGAGATFKVYLPRLGVAAVAPAPARPVPPPPGHETVLLVEDEGMLRALAREVLEEAGYRVLEAAGGEEALRLAGSHPGPIHLVLTDVVMPGISGRQVAERLAASRPEIKVLYTSGYTDDAVFKRGVLPEGTAFIHKPFTTDGLVRKVREILDLPARPREDPGGEPGKG